MFFLTAVIRRMTVTFHSHDPFTSSVRCAAGMWNCYAGCWQIRYTCPCPWVLLDGWLPWEWRRNVSKRLTGCSLTSFFVFLLFCFFTGGCSSTRKDTSPQTRRWAPSTAKWKEWVTPTWTEAKGSGMSPTTSSLLRLVCGQLGPSRDAGTLTVCHMTPNWSVLWFPSAASHRPLLTGLW